MAFFIQNFLFKLNRNIIKDSLALAKMKALVIKILSRTPVVYRLLKNLKKKISSPPKFPVLEAYLRLYENINFIQIGANDGTHNDPLYPFIKKGKWKGVLVEPIPYIFNKLLKTYIGFEQQLKFENSAIALENSKLKFYRLKENNSPLLPLWYDQIGSFNKEVVLKHRDFIPFFDELFIEDEVNGITFKNLLTKYPFERLNLIHIDAEGFDFEILKMIPFDQLSVDLILFEDRHLSGQDYQDALHLLEKNDYLNIKYEADTISVKKDIYQKLDLKKSKINMVLANKLN